MLDEDLAKLYGVSTSRLNEQVTRNQERFPEDFSYRLTPKELGSLKSHSATSRWGGRRKPPRVFTEHGAVMLASVLRTPVAVDASVRVVRAFVRLRGIIAAHEELSSKLSQIEQQLVDHDAKFETVFDAIRRLMEPPIAPNKPSIGFGRRES